VLLETLEYIAQALDGLPIKAHQAFLLSQIDGLTYQAIADQLDISLSTVRRHMAEALRRIAVALARQQAGIAAARTS
jgi:RNA polymerase sigma-70 factor (ECF subfamily)